MHIAFLTPEYSTPKRPEGGLANYILNVGNALVERGHRVSVFVLSNQGASWQDGKITVHEIRRMIVPRRLRAKQFHLIISEIFSSRRLASALWKIHRETPFDILQSTSYMAPGWALLRNGKLPLVCRVSSYTPIWRSAYGRKRNLGEYFSDWLEIRQVLDAEASFAPSQFVADAYAQLEGCQIQLIRTPVHLHGTEMDQSFCHEHLAGVPYLLFFGTLSRIKGVDLLAQVIPHILGRKKDLNFVFVGRDDGVAGGQKMFEYVRSQCKQFGQRIQYYSQMQKKYLNPVIANALGVLMPSRVDNYPNACLEAQSMGVPVVGTYNSSLEEMIIDGETGFLARNGDPDSLRQAVERLLAMKSAQKQQMQKRILDSIRSIEAQDRVGQLVSFYETLIDTFRKSK
jgi:glycosyltransferase involved in cell wall biosynthesis